MRAFNWLSHLLLEWLTVIDSAASSSDLAAARDVQAPSCGSSVSVTRSVAYYQSWNTHSFGCNKVWPNQLNVDGFTHLIMAYITIDPDTFHVHTMHSGDEELYQQFLALPGSVSKWIGKFRHMQTLSQANRLLQVSSLAVETSRTQVRPLKPGLSLSLPKTTALSSSPHSSSSSPSGTSAESISIGTGLPTAVLSATQMVSLLCSRSCVKHSVATLVCLLLFLPSNVICSTWISRLLRRKWIGSLYRLAICMAHGSHPAKV